MGRGISMHKLKGMPESGDIFEVIAVRSTLNPKAL